MKRYKIIFIIVLIASTANCNRGSWRDASRESAGIAPTPTEEPRAVVQAYAARVWGWRGWVADHTWIATKAQDADEYTVYQVIGWYLRRGESALRITNDIPDRLWFGNKPKLLLDIRGERADDLLDKIDIVARAYPYPYTYRMIPGPNSNTFTAWLILNIPEMQLTLPMRAWGKGYPFDIIED